MYLFWVGGCVCGGWRTSHSKKNTSKMETKSPLFLLWLLNVLCLIQTIQQDPPLGFYLKRMCSCPVVDAARVKKVILNLWMKLKSKISANVHREQRHNSCVPRAVSDNIHHLFKNGNKRFSTASCKKNRMLRCYRGCISPAAQYIGCVSCIMLLACRMSLEALCWSVAPCYILTWPTAC